LNLSYKIGSLAAVSITAVFFGFYVEPEPRHELEAINSIGKPPQQQEIPLKPDTVEKILKPDIVLPDDTGFPVNVTSINP
jgi:hypothetical protein